MRNPPGSWIACWIWRVNSISIVAEGVETKAQLDYLNRNNIVFQQGYYFFKPVPFTDLIKILLSKPNVKVMVE
jgi:EAL domain-containing protein (putative c-di-GMP-specific phosphodiesterase class I)